MALYSKERKGAQISKTKDNITVVDDRIDLDRITERDVDFRNFDHSLLPLEKETWPVIIMGSSLVGMMTGLLLGYHGVKTVSFDRHTAILEHPRAAGLNFRTCEILRQIGIEEHCKGENVRHINIEKGLLVVDKLIGGTIKANVQDHDVEKDDQISPSKWQWVTQDVLEPILTKYAPEHNYELVYNKEIVHYDEQPDGVIVVVKDLSDGTFKKYKTQYLVACDGNRSAARRKEGIKMVGEGVLGHGLSIRFQGDLERLMGDRAHHGIIYASQPDIKGAFRQEQRGKAGLLWVNNVGGRKDFPPGSVSTEEAKQYLYQLAGLNEGDGLEMLSFAHWTVASVTADRFLSAGGRVVLAGDSAHIMPPTGALGGNTGCNDAHNLAWKLAYAVTGRANHSLLQSYESERKPVDAFVVDQATRRLYNRLYAKTPPSPEEPYYIVEIGARYQEGAFKSAKGDVLDKEWEDPHKPSGSAGTRFLHVPLLGTDGNTISSLDLVKHNFLVVAAEDNSPWIVAAKALEFELDTYTLNESSQPYRDAEGKLKSKINLGSGGALVVRPDGYIAWRARNTASGHKESLQGVLSEILGQTVN